MTDARSTPPSEAANEKREESVRFEVWMDATRAWWRKWSIDDRAACSQAQIGDMMREAFEAGFNTGSAQSESGPSDIALSAIDSEPELPGDMPDEMWKAIRNDRDAIINAMRIAVRQTKEGIRERYLAAFAQR